MDEILMEVETLKELILMEVKVETLKEVVEEILMMVETLEVELILMEVEVETLKEV